MKLLRLLTFTAGAAVGYVVGAKQGQQGLDKIKDTARETWNDPKVQETVHKVGDQANRVAHDVADQAKDAVSAAAQSAEKKVSEAADDAKERLSSATGPGSDSDERPAPAAKADTISDPGLGGADSESDWADEGGRPASGS
ncbi:hypothetical protein [Nesterenkonia aerolata]|uniref:YtxH domain-containing protein n=1 Tax=Nesterenkonia aerolata TaxID=3074079 RepID=A0ABU2DR99_9MICC|nr:hypothetical protein [Nesterenkonia sp. LY-0111]MDR8019023.1 hypothetical protein [Nesterenkonia sp. LY-0111]